MYITSSQHQPYMPHDMFEHNLVPFRPFINDHPHKKLDKIPRLYANMLLCMTKTLIISLKLLTKITEPFHPYSIPSTILTLKLPKHTMLLLLQH